MGWRNLRLEVVAHHPSLRLIRRPADRLRRNPALAQGRRDSASSHLQAEVDSSRLLVHVYDRSSIHGSGLLPSYLV